MIKKVEEKKVPISGKNGVRRPAQTGLKTNAQKEEKSNGLASNIRKNTNSEDALKVTGVRGQIENGRNGRGSLGRPQVIPFVHTDYDIDLDPQVISFLYSLDGAGFDNKENPTSCKQWERKEKNPFQSSKKMTEFFYKYFDLDEEKDDKRLTFVGDK